ncbi:hypothetical protein MES5069_230127 [Mesorhizobium escarrei]|uniref:Type II toxin-antitoxin system HicB family antitoxin n=1 Tax=Mesorhizobium escarrei TaxID=666018 RepID=A0ABM9DST2_9HYPH|nr:hypothetical protein MES5069_230127 [Mesorhizobium escarrei]
MRYAVVIEKAGNNFSAYVPDLPGCIATGATVPEVETEIRDAIRRFACRWAGCAQRCQRGGICRGALGYAATDVLRIGSAETAADAIHENSRSEDRGCRCPVRQDLARWLSDRATPHFAEVPPHPDCQPNCEEQFGAIRPLPKGRGVRQR